MVNIYKGPKYKGRHLQKDREALEMTRAELAFTLDKDPATIWRWETEREDVPRAIYYAMQGLLKDWQGVV